MEELAKEFQKLEIEKEPQEIEQVKVCPPKVGVLTDKRML